MLLWILPNITLFAKSWKKSAMQVDAWHNSNQDNYCVISAGEYEIIWEQ